MINIDNVMQQNVQSDLCVKGDKALNNKSYEETVSFYNKALDSGGCKEAYFGLGQVYNAQGNIVRAIKNLTNAVRLDPTYHEAYSLLGEAYFSGGHGIASIENYAQAVAYKPDNDEYKQKLINVVSVMTFKKTNPNLKGVLLECLESGAVEFTHFGKAWLSIVSHDPLIKNIYKFSKYKNYDDFKMGMASVSNYDCLIEPFFLTGLGKFIVPNLSFERWCVFLRKFLLEAISDDKQIFSDPEDIDLITCAFAKYCFFTEYIFKLTPQENILIDKLIQKIESGSSYKLSELAIIACYKPLYFLKNAEEIAKILQGGDHVSQILKTQIEDYFAQQEIKKNIPVLTKIEDQVSSAVRDQYEEFPYPRWNIIAVKELFNDEIEGRYRGKKIKILNAGCGTGKEALAIASLFPDAQVTAVDLSRSSLAYAIFKARQFGLNNIKFMQGDIMELGSIKDRFDYIVSAGVLHHMKDPKAGWKVLNSLLKPDGLMRIALYSSEARWSVNAARSVIKDKKINSTAESIKDFRENIASYIKHKPIKNLERSYDYFSLSECRDLLFHVHEYQFNLPEIKNILDEFDFEFLQFYLSDSEISKYKKRNPNDANATDLLSWARYEKKNPNLFFSMYAFWCQRKS